MPQPDDSPLNRAIHEAIAAQEEAGLLRRRREIRPVDAVRIQIEGRDLVNFASNDYLGLCRHRAVIDAIKGAAESAGAGAGASPLITGYTQQHAAAEREIAAWKRTESAILLPSGYQAAHAAVQTLARLAETGQKGRRQGGVRFLVDKLAHASLIDAVLATQLPVRVFPHNHMGKLSRLLAEGPPQQMQVVVTESIFSMDGDAADLEGIAALKRRHGLVLLLDEAHGSGVYGSGGSGYASHRGLERIVDVCIVTLSKAMGLAGGAICASTAFCDAVANFGRAYIYSTAVMPAVAAGAVAAIGVMRDEPHRQARLRELSQGVRAELARQGRPLPPGDSPIIAIILGHERAAIEAARAMEDRGMLVAAVRPPTVARGTSRLRVTLSCEHTDEQVGKLLDCLAAVTPASGRS
jgi:8-amino-7-oxononanoate synthase